MVLFAEMAARIGLSLPDPYNEDSAIIPRRLTNVLGPGFTAGGLRKPVEPGEMRKDRSAARSQVDS